LAADFGDDMLYGDAQHVAIKHPAAIPKQLQKFAADALRRLVAQPQGLAQALGRTLTEPKPGVTFDEPRGEWLGGAAVVLDRRSRMMYDDHNVFINGECYEASGNDATLMRRLADQRHLDPRAARRTSSAAESLLGAWFEVGWLRLREE
jgi:50S ribosomal protein L16 3-hydroxylase